jgi:hypothetical protein
LALTEHPEAVRVLHVVLVTVTVLWPKIDEVDEALSTGCPRCRVCADAEVINRARIKFFI